MTDVEKGREHIGLMREEANGMGQIEYISNKVVQEILAYVTALEAVAEAGRDVQKTCPYEKHCALANGNILVDEETCPHKNPKMFPFCQALSTLDGKGE